MYVCVCVFVNDMYIALNTQAGSRFRYHSSNSTTVPLNIVNAFTEYLLSVGHTHEALA